MRATTRRLTEAATATLTPGERITSSGVGWAARRRDRVPLVFQGRRQYWMVVTDRRLLVFQRRRRGPGAHDLVLGKRFDFFTLEAVKRARPLLQVSVVGANRVRQVLEFRPGHRGLGSELVARLQADGSAPPAAASNEQARNRSTAAFWDER